MDALTSKVPFYRVVRGNGFWEPTARMKVLGFASVPCGPDGLEARTLANTWNERWQNARRSARERSAAVERSDRLGYVYFLRLPTRVKIGFTANPLTRIHDLKTGLSDRIVSIVAVTGSRADERALHRRLSAFRQSGEWFVASAIVLKIMSRSAALGRIERSEEALPNPEGGALVGTVSG